MKHTLLIRHAAQLVTVAGPDGPRAGQAQGKLEVIEDGAVYCEGERIVAVGTTQDVLARHPRAVTATRVIDASKRAVIPGLIDCHAHPVFAGDRSDEYVLRLQGQSYREIHQSGGGILKTVRYTRCASRGELLNTLRCRLGVALALGTTTMEAKTGYGLDEPTERKLLEVIRRASSAPRQCVELVPTLLFAHACPQELSADELVEAALSATPNLAGLAKFVDVFCESGFFDLTQSRRVLEAGKRAGLSVKIHADELSLLGGAKLGASLGAVSADHLLHTDDESLRALKEAGTVAVLLPGTPFVLGVKYADARRMISAAVPVAVASDFNPNCHCLSLPFVFVLAVYQMKMTPAEALVAMTINAAAALQRHKDLGSLVAGKQADIVVLKGPSYLHLGYDIGGNPVHAVIKRGRLVVRNRC